MIIAWKRDTETQERAASQQGQGSSGLGDLYCLFGSCGVELSCHRSVTWRNSDYH